MRRLGRSGPAVSCLSLGTMMFGDQTDADEAAAMLDRFIEAGGNFVDTADSYAGTRSETMLGKLLRQSGQDIVVATKCGNALPGIAGSGGLSPDWIIRAAGLSRERLQREAIDLFYLHHDDNRTPLNEIVSAIGTLLSQKTIASWGVSNFRPWKIAELVRLADLQGIDRPVAGQPYYHMLNRTAEADYIPCCANFGMSVIAYSPLARGVLTGKYRIGLPEGSRAARGDKRMLETEFHGDVLALAAKAAAFAEKAGRTSSGLALQWVLANSAVTSALAGARNLEQLERYIEAAHESYSAEEEAYLSALCAAGAIPVGNYFDPRMPLKGRKTKFGEE